MGASEQMRLIIAGSRKMGSYSTLLVAMRSIESWGPVSLVISGGAPGADALGEKWARARGIRVEHFPADWRQHGKAAGPIRNTAMAARGTGLVAFPDPDSRGTLDIISKCVKNGLRVLVWPIDYQHLY